MTASEILKSERLTVSAVFSDAARQAAASPEARQKAAQTRKAGLVTKVENYPWHEQAASYHGITGRKAGNTVYAPAFELHHGEFSEAVSKRGTTHLLGSSSFHPTEKAASEAFAELKKRHGEIVKSSDLTASDILRAGAPVGNRNAAGEHTTLSETAHRASDRAYDGDSPELHKQAADAHLAAHNDLMHQAAEHRKQGNKAQMIELGKLASGHLDTAVMHLGRAKSKIHSSSASPSDAIQARAASDVIYAGATANFTVTASSQWELGKPVEFMYMPGGVHTICAHFRGQAIKLTVAVDPSDAAKVLNGSLEQLRASYKHPPFGCVEHEEKDASVWAKQFTAKGDGVYLAADPSELGVRHVNGLVHRSWSPSFLTDADYSKATLEDGTYQFPDGVRGSESNPAKITGCAFCLGTLTNKPAFREMSPVKAREATIKAGTSDGVRKAWLTRRGEVSYSSESAHSASNSAFASVDPEDHDRAASEHMDAFKAHSAHAGHGGATKQEANYHQLIAAHHFQAAENHKGMADALRKSPVNASDYSTADTVKAGAPAGNQNAAGPHTLQPGHVVRIKSTGKTGTVLTMARSKTQALAFVRDHKTGETSHHNEADLEIVSEPNQRKYFHGEIPDAPGVMRPQRMEVGPVRSSEATGPKPFNASALLDVARALRLAHWNGNTATNEHEALGELYDAWEDGLDDLVEATCGKRGCKVSEPAQGNTALAEQALAALSRVKDTLTAEDDDLLNIVADMENAVNKGRYLLKAKESDMTASEVLKASGTSEGVKKGWEHRAYAATKAAQDATFDVMTSGGSEKHAAELHNTAADIYESNGDKKSAEFHRGHAKWHLGESKTYPAKASDASPYPSLVRALTAADILNQLAPCGADGKPAVK